MRFDIGKFAEEFKNTIDWMLKNEHSKKIKEDFQFFKDNRDELKKNPDSVNALRMIIELVITNGWRLRKPKDFDSKMESFIEKRRRNFRMPQARKISGGILLNGTRASPEVSLVPSALRLTSGLRLRFASSNLPVRASLRLARPNKFANPSPVI